MKKRVGEEGYEIRGLGGEGGEVIKKWCVSVGVWGGGGSSSCSLGGFPSHILRNNIFKILSFGAGWGHE